MSGPEDSNTLNSDSDFVCPSSPKYNECDEVQSDSEEPHDVQEAGAGTQWSSIRPNSSRTHARNIIHRPMNKIVNANHHPSIQIHF